ncbi:hypothetical protein [Alkalihalobacillus pseudalcaliphilus]|nr:hypothetical protein [Alkalihalobacillus pseudalcaliphilus]
MRRKDKEKRRKQKNKLLKELWKKNLNDLKGKVKGNSPVTQSRKNIKIIA